MKTDNGKHAAPVLLMVAVVGMLVAAAGCATLDRAYQPEVTWTNVPTIHVFTNTVVVTNTVPVVTERTNYVYVTNAASGGDRRPSPSGNRWRRTW